MALATLALLFTGAFVAGAVVVRNMRAAHANVRGSAARSHRSDPKAEGAWFQLSHTGKSHPAANVIGVAAPQTQWDFAEGYSSPTVNERYMLSNPTGVTATATVAFYLADGSAHAAPAVTLVPSVWPATRCPGTFIQRRRARVVMRVRDRACGQWALTDEYWPVY